MNDSYDKIIADLIARHLLELRTDPTLKDTEYRRIAYRLQALSAEAAVSDAVMQALIDAKDLAMHNTLAARMPECGDFGKIAQNLDYALQELQAATTKDAK